jgi:hypothetical protein
VCVEGGEEGPQAGIQGGTAVEAEPSEPNEDLQDISSSFMVRRIPACSQFQGRQSSHYGACRHASARIAFSSPGPKRKQELRCHWKYGPVLLPRSQGPEVDIAIHQDSTSSKRSGSKPVLPTRSQTQEMGRCGLVRKIHQPRSWLRRSRKTSRRSRRRLRGGLRSQPRVLT